MSVLKRLSLSISPLQIKEEDKFTTIYEGTVAVTTSYMWIVIKQSGKAPRVKFIGIYETKQ